MLAASFDESNDTLSPPDDMTYDDCEALSIWRGKLDNENPVIISCWKPTKEELEEINKTGRVYLVVWGYGMPPVALLGGSPFPKPNPEFPLR